MCTCKHVFTMLHALLSMQGFTCTLWALGKVPCGKWSVFTYYMCTYMWRILHLHYLEVCVCVCVGTCTCTMFCVYTLHFLVHTMDELRLTGNCLLGSRPLLSFDEVCMCCLTHYCRQFQYSTCTCTLIHSSMSILSAQPRSQTLLCVRAKQTPCNPQQSLGTRLVSAHSHGLPHHP